MAESYDDLDEVSAHGISPLGDGSSITEPIKEAVESVVEAPLKIAGSIAEAGCDIAGRLFRGFFG